MIKIIIFSWLGISNIGLAAESVRQQTCYKHPVQPENINFKVEYYPLLDYGKRDESHFKIKPTQGPDTKGEPFSNQVENRQHYSVKEKDSKYKYSVTTLKNSDILRCTLMNEKDNSILSAVLKNDKLVSETYCLDNQCVTVNQGTCSYLKTYKGPTQYMVSDIGKKNSSQWESPFYRPKPASSRNWDLGKKLKNAFSSFVNIRETQEKTDPKRAIIQNIDGNDEVAQIYEQTQKKNLKHLFIYPGEKLSEKNDKLFQSFMRASCERAFKNHSFANLSLYNSERPHKSQGLSDGN